MFSYESWDIMRDEEYLADKLWRHGDFGVIVLECLPREPLSESIPIPTLSRRRFLPSVRAPSVSIVSALRNDRCQ